MERRMNCENEMRISVPQKNIEKFKQVILYILTKIGAKSNFINKFNATKCLGWSPSISWIIANIFTDDVTHIRVINPTEDLVIASDECVALSSLEFV
jgi:hypothetical protein